MKKLGRDVTFESKHVIFLLQRCANSRYIQYVQFLRVLISHFCIISSCIVSFSDSQKNENFAEADERIKFIDDCKFKEIALEVCGLNGELYARSYDWGTFTIMNYHNFFLFFSSILIVLQWCLNVLHCCRRRRICRGSDFPDVPARRSSPDSRGDSEEALLPGDPEFFGRPCESLFCFFCHFF